MENEPAHHPASFRDPEGFLFQSGGEFYRQVNRSYKPYYDLLTSSGLYTSLVEKGMLIPSPQVTQAPPRPELAYVVLKPERLAFISYPYEWSFGQLKDAALLTLDLHKRALDKGMILKDASAYNIQFVGSRPLLIDTLSFESYVDGKPWVAYRQFCQHFLAPLALMALVDVRLGSLLRIHIDGIPLDLASRLLPWRTRLNPGLLTHIHLHASAQRRATSKDALALKGANTTGAPRQASFNKMAMLGLVDSLESAVGGLSWQAGGTAWGDYYNATNYTPAAFEQKKAIVASFIERIQPASLWDLGANTGVFSEIASQRSIPTVAFDYDPAAIEQAYLKTRQEKNAYLIPLLLDLTNPSPGLGWNGRERQSLFERGPVDAVLALALIHHLAIANNVPLPDLADFFARIGSWLVVEFIPKTDSQVVRLLSSRLDIFDGYTEAGFEDAFSRRFNIIAKEPVAGSQRCLYLMQKRK